MKALRLRLLINVMAMAAIGLSLADVGFVFYAQQQLREQRHAALFVAAAQFLPHLSDPPAEIPTVLRAIAAQFNMELTLYTADGATFSSGGEALPPLPNTQGVVVQAGREHLVMPLMRLPWRLLVVSRQLNDMLGPLYAAHVRALAVISACAAVMVWVGTLFLRRTVVAPLQRLAELLRQQDTGQWPGRDDLSGAIIAMVHTLQEDKTRIAAQLRALEQTQSQLVRAERLAVVGRLAAGFAHEIGNPLAVLHGFVEILSDGDTDASERQQVLERMAKEIHRIHRTVRQLLDFSRASTPGEAGDLTEALRYTAELLRPQERFRAIALITPDLTEPTPVRLSTDALVQVLLNLLLNAADALTARPGGTIRVSVAHQDGMCCIGVDDSGPGIEATVQAHIFEPFFTTKAAGVGTGLGLAVCERIVTAAGGDISVARSELGGARFTVLVPVLTA